MARGTYLTKNMNKQQIDLMLLLDDLELEIFTLSELKNITRNKYANLSELIENLADKKILARIERGKYCRSNFTDEKVIGCFMAGSGAVAYWSALNLHGLTDQFPNNIFIQTNRPRKSKTVFGVPYKFVNISPTKITGLLTQGQGNRQYRITDPEKTIIDCFDLYQYSGGYAELISAFSRAKLNSNKMINYCKAIDNIAAIKRMGFLAQFMNKSGFDNFIEFARMKRNKAYNPFDPAGPDKGEFVNEWRLRLNISREEIMGICSNFY
jgi:predicted transcriptional regulator of viral defense system